MGLVISTNISSLIASYNLGKNTKSLTKATERISSGYKINHASDNAAGLSISEKLRTQIRGSKQAIENSQDGINLLQVTEGSLSVVIENLQRIRDLTIQSASDTNSTVERDAIKTEVESRVADIQRIVSSTSFNKINLLDGSTSQYTLRTGPNSDNNTNTLDISAALGQTLLTFLSTESTTGALSAAYQDGTSARSFLNTIDDAIKEIATKRSQLGSLQVRLESNIQNMSISRENLISTESRVRDIDVAEITAELAKKQMLQQASISIISQANQLPAMALDLLKQ